MNINELKSDDLLRQKVINFLGIEEGEENSTDTQIAMFSQITFALFFVVLMANLIFMAKAKEEVRVAKGMIGVIMHKYEEVANSDEGEQYKLREMALIDLQKQILLNALDKVETSDRFLYGLKIFTKKLPDGQIEYLLGDVLLNEKITNIGFKSACNAAKKDLPDHNKMCESWMLRVLSMQGMSIDSTSVDPAITKNPEILVSSNTKWLVEEIDKRVLKIYSECCDMQRAAVASLKGFYFNNTHLIKDKDISKLVKKYVGSPVEDKPMIIKEIKSKLHEYAKSKFISQEVALLNDV